MHYNILMIGINEIESWFIRQLFSEDEYSFVAVSLKEDEDSIEEEVLADIHVAIISDVWFRQRGFSVLGKICKFNTVASVIVITDYKNIELARAAVKYGAYTFVFRPFDIDELKIVVMSAVEKWQMKTRLNNFKKEELKKGGFETIIAESDRMKAVISSAMTVANVDTTVLIEGETGVGKDRIARAIHLSSSRSDRPFIEVSCAAIPESLLESELFGHVKGAYTGALSNKEGLFAMAKGGTVFFNEIGDMPLSVQPKILKLIEDKSFRMVGGRKEIVIDVRILCATCIYLKKAVEDGRFRRDLFYRINVFPVYIPPLRERRDDIMALARCFVGNFNEKFRKNVRGFTDGAEKILKAYSWPGNVRELCNTIERIMIIKKQGYISENDIPLDIRQKTPAVSDSGLAGLEKEVIRNALRETGNNISKTAKILGIGRGALRYKMKKYGIAVE